MKLSSHLRPSRLLLPILFGLPTLSLAATKNFELSLTWGPGSPDGFERDMFFVNGQFPGPTIEADEGDNVEILVKNDTPFNSSIHYHGIEMLGTPWSDGVPGLTQYNIEPGCQFTYKWKATQHGAFFYHSHAQSQIADGLYGSLLIHPSADTKDPFSLIASNEADVQAIKLAERERIPIMLSDWRHHNAAVDWEVSEKSKIEHLCFDSILINGKGSVNCVPKAKQAGLMTPGQKALLATVDGAELTDKSCLPPEVLATLGAPGDLSVIPNSWFNECEETSEPADVITIDAAPVGGKWVVFDLIGNFALATCSVSIDGVTMHVFAADGNYISPSSAQAIPLTNGERYTVLVHFTKPGRYPLRVASLSDPQILYGHSYIDYTSSSSYPTSYTPTQWIDQRGNPYHNASITVFDRTLSALPFPPQPIDPTADGSSSSSSTYKLTLQIDTTGNHWAFNSTSRPQSLDTTLDPPVLFSQNLPQTEPDNDIHTLTIPKGQPVTDLILLIPPGQPPHPIHIHGRHFRVLGEGTGDFPYETVSEAFSAIPESFPYFSSSGEGEEGGNAPLRDSYPTLSSGAGDPTWLALRKINDNPGAWLMHCHIQSHLQGGMSMVINEAVDETFWSGGEEGGEVKIPGEYYPGGGCAVGGGGGGGGGLYPVEKSS